MFALPVHYDRDDKAPSRKMTLHCWTGQDFIYHVHCQITEGPYNNSPFDLIFI